MYSLNQLTYSIFGYKMKNNIYRYFTLWSVIFLSLYCMSGKAQVNAAERISITEVVDMALKNNSQFRINESEISKADFTKKTAYEIPKTGIFAENEDFRPSDNRGILKIGVSQGIAWPGLYKARKKYFDEQLKYYQTNVGALEAVIKRDVRSTYYLLWYLQDKQKLYLRLDSIYTSLYNTANLRVKTGEAAGLERISSNAKMQELRAQMQQTEKDIQMQQQQLMLLVNINKWLLPVSKPLGKLEASFAAAATDHPALQLQGQNIKIAASEVAVQKNTNKPEFSGRVFSQRLWGAADPFTGFSVTAAFPLFGKNAYKNKINVANAELEIQQTKLMYETQKLNTESINAQIESEKYLSMLQFYENTALLQAREILDAATLGYKGGEISFAEYNQFLAQVIDTEKNHLEILNNYNQSVIQLKYYNNQ